MLISGIGMSQKKRLNSATSLIFNILYQIYYQVALATPSADRDLK